MKVCIEKSYWKVPSVFKSAGWWWGALKEVKLYGWRSWTECISKIDRTHLRKALGLGQLFRVLLHWYTMRAVFCILLFNSVGCGHLWRGACLWARLLFFFFPIVLRYNWNTTLHKFKVYSIMICFTYIVKMLITVSLVNIHSHTDPKMFFPWDKNF